ncbi:MAG: hypothetical protein KAJ49_09465, partial [Arcobacteraceae bacterium]|nr:hypothetical protein [Arcobacteraceae bacterium]
MKSKYKIILSLSVIYIITNILVYNITEINKSQRIQVALDAKINKLQMHYSILIDQQTKMANAVFKLTMENKDVNNILLKANATIDKAQLNSLREQLKQSLSYRYKILKKRGVLQYHIVLPNNISFLRMHKQDKFGDNLVNTRLDMVLVNKEKKIVRGFHQGRTAHGFRNVYPIFSENKIYLGAIEISFSSDTFQNNLKDISKVHTHFLVNKDIFKANTWSSKDLILAYEQSSEHSDYMITLGGIHTRERCIVRNAQKLKPIRDEINKNVAKGEKFSLYNPWKAGIQTATFLPIKNSITNETAAWIVSYEQSPFIETTIMGGKIIRAISFIGLMLLFYFIYRTLNQKEILDIEVQEKTKELNYKAEVLSKTARELEESEHELEEINKNLEKRIKEEVEKNNNIQDQLYKSEKMASMGEMIGNI